MPDQKDPRSVQLKVKLFNKKLGCLNVGKYELIYF